MLTSVRAGDAVLVIAPGPVPGDLLDLLDGARERVAVLSVDTGDPALAGIAHERMLVGGRDGDPRLPRPRGPRGATDGPGAFSIAEHVLAALIPRRG